MALLGPGRRSSDQTYRAGPSRREVVPRPAGFLGIPSNPQEVAGDSTPRRPELWAGLKSDRNALGIRLRDLRPPSTDHVRNFLRSLTNIDSYIAAPECARRRCSPGRDCSVSIQI